jgi:hypothetical protein
LGVSFGSDEIRNGLGLGQVETSIQDRATGKLAGLGVAQTRLDREITEQCRHHSWPAMGLKLDHILSGVGKRCRKSQNQSAVY